MKRVFVDPMVHSKKVQRFQVITFVMIMLVIAAAVWARFMMENTGSAFRLSLMLTALVIAATGLGYYMMMRNQGVMREHMWIEMDDEGVRSMTPAGEVFCRWEEIEEVRVSNRPSRNRMPDLLIKTGKGYINTHMRFSERGVLPEPLLRSPGVMFRGEEGAYRLGPDKSRLVAALKQKLPQEKVKQGAVLSL